MQTNRKEYLMNKNTQIKVLYEHIKQLLPSEKFLEKNSFIIKTDNNKHHYYEFYSGVLETSQFKLNLSIPSYLDEYLGVYISITIPQFMHSGTLFEASSAGKFIVKNTLDTMGEQNIDNLSMNNIEEICNDYIKYNSI
jgi:hypothetical protein